MNELKIYDVTCEYRKNPIGLDVKKPRLSWKIQSDRRGTTQLAYQLQVSLKFNFETPIWDTGYIESEQSLHIDYAGPELKSTTRYYYRVKVWDHFGRQSDWSDIAWWETAFFETNEWKAKWITPNPQELDPASEPAFLLRKEFNLKDGIESARIYATGVGLYELYLNGQCVGEDLLAPGWTSYSKRIQYQTYDVTALLTSSSNAIGAMLADGWYKGDLSWDCTRNNYGTKRGIILQLNVRYDDGTEDLLVSDHTWKAFTGPILYSELYHGEVYDARLEQRDWSKSDFNDSKWMGTDTLDLPLENLVAQENNPTRVIETIKPQAVLITPAGDTVLDMGQNMVGRIRFTVTAPAGTKITLKHAEVLDKDGNVYFGNLRSAKQTVEYITKGEGMESYAPVFTFQGFRYVKIEGYPGQENGLNLEHFVGEVIHTDMVQSGNFKTSNPVVNQLQQNIKWGQRGNFVDVPTDCPQRDERLGWTGDAQVFIRTALFNYQGGPFFTKWLRDLKADQLPNGGVPFVIPNVVDGDSSAAWGDAAVICPWTVYLSYSDTRLLEEQYPSMQAWVEYIRAQGEMEYAWNTGFHFGDWLGLDSKEDTYFGATPDELIATAFYAYSTRLLRDTAKVLNKVDDVKQYDELLIRIKKYYNDEFITPLGRLAVTTQTAHVLTLMFDLVEGKIRERISYDLNQLVLENDYHLTTGFVGTPYLNLVLSNNGYHETAVKLLLQETFPSWLYSVSKGATTIWEHWDGIKEDDSFWSDDMNSFNHYAYGAIGDWMYRVVAGLDMDETEPAYKRIRIQPRIGGKELTYARATYDSMYGRIVSAWNITHEEVTIEVEIPVNTTAQIILPFANKEDVKENGIIITKVEGIFDICQTDKGVSLVVGSGQYRFVYKNERGFRTIYSANTRLIDLLLNEEMTKTLEMYVPGISNPHGQLARLKAEPIEKLLYHPMSKLTEDRLNALINELNALEEKLVTVQQ
ncbi:glycoside hydrolase family 78 protein [Neobacillus drentensis]|uniref:alpha-L-rhamnosidase n=1 Tax=Neobacillus drentensis TaxID=220684 RepID=UPI001F3608BA|nr:alpha-L-rhamnosidase [Neobacillus drentensis]ULT59852.1 glycoside hydrolase family 78 protein [Neobacillus drentensis]